MEYLILDIMGENVDKNHIHIQLYVFLLIIFGCKFKTSSASISLWLTVYIGFEIFSMSDPDFSNAYMRRF